MKSKTILLIFLGMILGGVAVYFGLPKETITITEVPAKIITGAMIP